MSQDGTRKWVVACHDGAMIEMAFIPELGRGTVYVSFQVVCGLACRFCDAGSMGFQRNLKLSEVLGQAFLAEQRLRDLRCSLTSMPLVSNVVF